MPERLSIGDFAQRCGLSRSALRFYDQNGLLAPAWVDEETAYRFYAPQQLDDALLIRRLRAAELPVARLRAYLAADPSGRAEILDRHAGEFRQRADAVATTLAELRAELDAARTGAEARWCRISAERFGAALDQIGFALADPAARPELARVWLETRDQSLRLVATDSYRMAVRDVVPESLGSAAVRGTIDVRAARGLTSGLESGELLTLRQDVADTITAAAGGRSEQVGGEDANFPEYERILSELPAGAQVVLDRHDLQTRLSRLPAAERVALSFGPTGVTLRADGETADLDGEWAGNEFVLHLDQRFFTDAVTAMVGPDVTIEAVGPFEPITLRSADTGTFSVLTMPIRP